VLRIYADATLDRTDHLTLGLIKMPNTFGAERWVDDVVVWPHRDGLVRADGLADITVDAFSRNDERHVRLEAWPLALLF